MEEGDAGPHDEIDDGEGERELGEVLDCEWGWECRGVEGETDLLEGFATGGLDGRFLGGVGFACGGLVVGV